MSSHQFLLEISFYATVLIAVFLVALTVIASIAFWKGEAKTFTTVVLNSYPLQMLTICLIIFAATALRMLELIQTEAIVSILSGIAGYVLGGTKWSAQQRGD
jgi:hypothetical protein